MNQAQGSNAKLKYRVLGLDLDFTKRRMRRITVAAIGAGLALTLIAIYSLPRPSYLLLLSIVPITLVYLPCTVVLGRFAKGRLDDTWYRVFEMVFGMVLLTAWIFRYEKNASWQNNAAFWLLFWLVLSEVQVAIFAWNEPDLVEVAGDGSGK